MFERKTKIFLLFFLTITIFSLIISYLSGIVKPKYAVGDIISVKITAVLDNLGAFAEVVPGQDGLVHISQISKERVEKNKRQASRWRYC